MFAIHEYRLQRFFIMRTSVSRYHRFPAEIISQFVWLYFRRNELKF